MIRVLHITSSLDGGGIASFLFSYSKRMIGSKFHFDFVVTSSKKGYLEEKLEKMGCRVFHITKMRNNPFKCFRDIKQIILEGAYDVVHSHSSYKSYFFLNIAKKYGVKKRIAHAHSAVVNQSFFGRILKMIFMPLTIRVATDLFACGQYAGDWAWKKNDYQIIPNAIETSKYAFSSKIREQITSDLNLSGKTVLGTVSRLSPEKNHLFLLDVFKEYLLINEKTVLIIVGGGEQENALKKHAKKIDVYSKVIFLGSRKDVNFLLNCFDCFVLPSKYEGLPVTIVEAEMNGLPCLISDSVTKEVAFNSNVAYLPLKSGSKQWAQKLDELVCSCRVKEKISSTVYNIDNAINILKKNYENE